MISFGIIRLSYETVKSIFANVLSVRHFIAKSMPRLLSDDQKQSLIAVFKLEDPMNGELMIVILIQSTNQCRGPIMTSYDEQPGL